MDLQENLIESSKKGREKRGWKASAASITAHGLLIGAIVYAGSQAAHKVTAEEKPITAFITRGAAPPPPPPPPPPAASSASTPKPQMQRPEPVRVEPQPFTQPTEIPKETPEVETLTTEKMIDLTQQPDPTPQPEVTGGDVAGGVAGGVTGGVTGGQVGGTVGGEIGGVQGGVLGGTVGGQLGGQGTGTEGTGTGGDDAPLGIETAPAGPLRVGGDVKAPITVTRIDPDYTETARKARVSGVVIVEAVINKYGRVERVKVVKGLPMGLSESAEHAVRQWRFKPGTLNGQPVDTIFNLTVNFKLD